MDSEETEDSIEEICFDRKTVFGNKRNSCHTDLMKGIIVNIRGEADSSPGKAIKKSQNVLIAMLEELVSRKDASEKKRILEDEYGMTMTAELERRIQIMCNWSESIIERERIRERIDAIGRMIRADITKEQILSMGYTEAEYKKAESALYVNA
jgi:hypothetical protein